MKKLLFAVVLAGSMVAVAADAAKTETKVETAPAPAQKEMARPSKLTDEQRAQIKARREKFMAERKARQAEMQTKILETIKKYVPDEAKAKELQAELDKVMMSARRPMMGGRPIGPRPMKPLPTAK